MNRGLQLTHLNIKMRAIESLRKVVAPPYWLDKSHPAIPWYERAPAW
jgi:hypothetical protein